MRICCKCGGELKKGEKTCPNCGLKWKYTPDSWMAAIALGLSIFSWFWPVGILSAVLAVLSFLFHGKTKRIRLAVAGLIITAVFISLVLLKKPIARLITSMIDSVRGCSGCPSALDDVE